MLRTATRPMGALRGAAALRAGRAVVKATPLAARVQPVVRALSILVEAQKLVEQGPPTEGLTMEKAGVSVEVRPDGVAFIWMDQPGSKVNSMTKEFAWAVGKAVMQVRTDPKIKAGVLASKKPGCFMAGGDLKMLGSVKTAKEGEEVSLGAQGINELIATSSRPFVAMIEGSCMGMGLEMALAWLVGVQEGMTMCLTGKTVKPEKAKKMGLVDNVADPNALLAATELAVKDALSGKPRKQKKKPLVQKFLEDNGRGRSIMFGQARKMVMKQSGGHYPAPPLILDVVEKSMNSGMEEGLKLERENFGKLTVSEPAAALQSIFFGKQKCDKNAFGVPSIPIDKVAILGAGLMGAGIAQVSSQKAKQQVLLKDVNWESVGKGVAQIRNSLDPKVKRKKMPFVERDLIMSRIHPAIGGEPWVDRFLGECNLVIEAIPEDLALKHKILGALEDQLSETCIIGTNTSALPIAEVAKPLKRPQNVVGMHYFSPVDKMPLLEIIITKETSEEAKKVAVEVGIRQGKTVIVVNDGPGFYTTRILAPYMAEGLAILKDGLTPSEVDVAIQKFGFPVGPVTLFDEVGIDVGAHIAEDMTGRFGDRMGSGDIAGDKQLMQFLVENDWHGRKTKAGFYLYSKPKLTLAQKLNPFYKPPKKAMNEALLKGFRSMVNGQGHTKPAGFNKKDLKEIQQRVCMRMVNEAVYAFQDGILTDPVDGDIGAVFGLGFPPFFGGPFRYFDKLGAQAVHDTMRGLRDRHGPRFEPAPLIEEMAKGGKKFHA